MGAGFIDALGSPEPFKYLHDSTFSNQINLDETQHLKNSQDDSFTHFSGGPSMWQETVVNCKIQCCVNCDSVVSRYETFANQNHSQN